MNLEFAKIYKVVNHTNNKIYIGSTCARLMCVRMCKLRANKSSRMYRMIGNMDDCKIELVEELKVDNIIDLRKKERHYIEEALMSNKVDCINKNIPNRSRAEYMRNYRLQKKMLAAK